MTATKVKPKSRSKKVQDAPLFKPGKNLLQCSWCRGYYRAVPRNFHKDVQKDYRKGFSCWCRACTLCYQTPACAKRHLMFEKTKTAKKATIPVSEIMRVVKQ